MGRSLSARSRSALRYASLMVLAAVLALAAAGAASARLEGRSARVVRADRMGPRWFSPSSRALSPSSLAMPGVHRISRGLQPGSRVTRLGTRFSNTYVAGGGRLVARIYAMPVNYRTASGRLVAINSRLVARGSGFAQQANDLGVTLPRAASGAVRMSGVWGSLSLMPVVAGGAGRVSGAAESFAGGSGLSYVSDSAGIAWSDQLSAVAAARGLQWRVRLSRGLSAVIVRGGVAFRTRSGRTVWVFAAPAARASGDGRRIASRLTLAHRTGGLVVTEKILGVSVPATTSVANVRVSDVLAAHALLVADVVRPQSVTMNGAVYPGYNATVSGITGDCYIASASPSTSYCDQTTDYVGPNDSILLNFNIGASVPDHSTILDAWIAEKQTSESDDTSEQVGIWQAAEPWTSSATWNTYDGTHSWTTPGGDVTGSLEDDNTYGAASDVGKYSYWSVPPSTQVWTDHNPSQVDGFVLKPTGSSVTDVEGFAGQASSTPPYMQVYYIPRAGDDPGQQNDSQSLTDRSQIGVNEASGDLDYTSADIDLTGIDGLDLSLGRSYNNLTRDQDSLGYGWSMTGPDTYLVVPSDKENELDYFDGTGSAQLYQTSPSGSWIIPPGSDALVSMNASGTYAASSFSLFFRHSGITETFTATANALPKYARLSTVTNRDGDTISYSYNASGQLTSIKDTYGNTTTLTWTNGYITKIVDPTGRTYQYSQNASGELASYIDPANNTTYYSYDGNGNLIKVVTAAGNVTQIGYTTDGSQRVASVERFVHPSDTNGPTTSFSYAGDSGKCASAPNSDGGWKELLVSDPNSHVTTYCTDDLGRVVESYDPDGNARGATYTTDGFANKLTSALGTPETFSYNNGSTDDVTGIQDGTGGGALSQSFAYPTGGSNMYLPTSSTDAQANTDNYGYSATGDLTSITDPLSTHNQATLTYNSNGTVKTSVDPLSNTTGYAYYPNGTLQTITPPGPENPTTLTYDSANRVVKLSTIANGGGHEIDYTYDPFDRITQEVYKNASGATYATLSYTYDADGNLIKRVDPQGTTTYTYDGMNRVTGESFPDGSTDSYGYDPASNLTSLTDAGGTTNYGYDPADELTSITDPGASTATKLSYDADGNLTKLAYPSGASVAWTLNGMDQVTNVADTYNAGSSTYALTYAYTYAGDLEHTMTDVAGNVTTYSYDSLNRLIDAKTVNGSSQIRDNAYTLDADGNILTSTVNGTPTNYGYNADNQICWSDSGATSNNNCSPAPARASSYAYDTDGNETSNGSGTTFAYNPLDQMTSETVSGTQTNFAYDGDNQDQLITDGSTSLHNDVLGIGWTKTSGASTYYTRTTSGAHIDERTPAGTYNYLYDGNGNVVGLTNSAGQLVRQYNYDPYGNLTYSTGTTVNPFGYQDGYQTTSGLDHFGARLLSPTQGNWTQQDPLSQISDLEQDDRYVYTADDPTNETDPTGTTIRGCVLAATAVLACVPYYGPRNANLDQGTANAATIPAYVYKRNPSGAQVSDESDGDNAGDGVPPYVFCAAHSRGHWAHLGAQRERRGHKRRMRGKVGTVKIGSDCEKVSNE